MPRLRHHPYLNVILPNVIAYGPEAKILTLRKKPGLITLYPHMVTMTQVKNADEALELLAALRDRINEVWEKRETITPCYEKRVSLRPLGVYTLFPATNCKHCGEATCMAFAFGLIEGRHKLEECQPLWSEPFAAQREKLLGLLGVEVEAEAEEILTAY